LTFLSGFAEAFSDADIVVITDIYSAGEPNLGQISGEQVRDAICAAAQRSANGVHHENVYYSPTLSSVTELLTQILQPGDLALFLGAGNLNQIIPQVIDFYQKAEKDQLRELSQKA